MGFDDRKDGDRWCGNMGTYISQGGANDRLRFQFQFQSLGATKTVRQGGSGCRVGGLSRKEVEGRGENATLQRKV